MSQATMSGDMNVHHYLPQGAQHQGMQQPQAATNPKHRLPSVPTEPEIQVIRLTKSNSGMGLSIVAAKGVGKDRLGIYIKAVVPGGAAYLDGRLQAGDQVTAVANKFISMRVLFACER